MPRQVRAVVTIVALVTVTIGLLVGVPLRIARGRLGWRFTAHAVYVDTDPRVLAAIVGVTLVTRRAPDADLRNTSENSR